MTSFLLIVALAGALYLVIANLRVAAFARRPLALASEFLPTFSILKPIAGSEPGLYENLVSFCAQEYEQEYEVIFCLHAGDDPALSVVERVMADFPECRSRIAVGENPTIANPKIANLAKPGAEPNGEIVVISDSDVRVGPDYLRALAASFESERVGAATCLYGSIPNANIVSRLGALHVEDEFAPSVLVALALGKLRFCLGATMAVRRSVLAEIGGLAALGGGLADDHTLGRLVTAHGYEIDLSRYVVHTAVPETALHDLWSHELRWARTNLALAPAGYALSFLTFALPFAFFYLVASRNLGWGLPLLLFAFVLRFVLHAGAGSVLRASNAREQWLVPLRDFLSLAVWLASFFGRTVDWRSKRYTMRR